MKPFDKLSAYMHEPGTAFPTRLHVRPAKTLISDCASAQSDQSLRRVLFWETKNPKRLQANSEDSNQTALFLHVHYCFLKI